MGSARQPAQGAVPSKGRTASLLVPRAFPRRTVAKSIQGPAVLECWDISRSAGIFPSCYRQERLSGGSPALGSRAHPGTGASPGSSTSFPRRGPSPQTVAEILGPSWLPPAETELRSLGRPGPAAIGYRLASQPQPGPSPPFMGCPVQRANRRHRHGRVCLHTAEAPPWPASRTGLHLRLTHFLGILH